MRKGVFFRSPNSDRCTITENRSNHKKDNQNPGTSVANKIKQIIFNAKRNLPLSNHSKILFWKNSLRENSVYLDL